MLPEILSNGICSLQPEQKRFAKSAYITYDKDANMIGMKFTNNDTDEGAIKITKRKNSGISFSSSAFLNYYGIDYNETTKYDLEYDNKNELYVFSLEGRVI